MRCDLMRCGGRRGQAGTAKPDLACGIPSFCMAGVPGRPWATRRAGGRDVCTTMESELQVLACRGLHACVCVCLAAEAMTGFVDRTQAWSFIAELLLQLQSKPEGWLTRWAGLQSAPAGAQLLGCSTGALVCCTSEEHLQQHHIMHWRALHTAAHHPHPLDGDGVDGTRACEPVLCFCVLCFDDFPIRASCMYGFDVCISRFLLFIGAVA